MKYDFLILGADGMQGKIVTRDLLEKGYSVFAADLYKTGVVKILKRHVRQAAFAFIDLRQVPAVTALIKKSGAPIVINCADMDWNGNVYQACLKAKAHCVDLGAWIEMTEWQLGLDRAFKRAGLTAVAGSGCTPGINNVMLNYAARQFDRLHSVDVGFSWTSNVDKFVVPFHMKSILEEFTYDPRFLQNGRWVSVKALSMALEREFRAIGRQKVFLVQHPELFTYRHYFKDRGLANIRFFAGFPVHSLEKIYALIAMGFHSEKPLMIEGTKVAPIDLLTPVLKNLMVPPGYLEKENLWVEIRGEKDGRPKQTRMECIVPTLPGWEEHGCNIDTGLPAAIIAEMIRDERISERGSFAPEAVVPPEELFAELGARSMIIYQDGAVINRDSLPAGLLPRLRRSKQPMAEAFI